LIAYTFAHENSLFALIHGEKKQATQAFIEKIATQIFIEKLATQTFIDKKRATQALIMGEKILTGAEKILIKMMEFKCILNWLCQLGCKMRSFLMVLQFN